MRDGPGNVAPRADQPRATAKSADRSQQPASLEYRVQGIRSNTKSSGRSYDRSYRG